MRGCGCGGKIMGKDLADYLQHTADVTRYAFVQRNSTICTDTFNSDLIFARPHQN